jgi:hypothetical protein
MRSQLSISARLFAERHSWKKIAEETIAVYQRLL